MTTASIMNQHIDLRLSGMRETNANRLKQAAFRQPATLEGIDLSMARGLNKAIIKDLNSGRFLLDGMNVIIMGTTGVGRSYLATAIGNSVAERAIPPSFTE
jgi:DNA replication protein DnaC